MDSAYKNAYAAHIGVCVGIISRKAVGGGMPSPYYDLSKELGKCTKERGRYARLPTATAR